MSAIVSMNTHDVRFPTSCTDLEDDQRRLGIVRGGRARRPDRHRANQRWGDENIAMVLLAAHAVPDGG